MTMECNPRTLVHALRHHYETDPHHRIFTWIDKKGHETNQTLTYQQLWLQSGLVADLLETKGLSKGDRVMIAYPFGLDFLAGMFGCMRAGMVACSVYPPNPTRLKTDLPLFMKKVNDAGANYALTTNQFRRAMYAATIFSRGTGDLQWLATDRLTSSASGGSVLPRTMDDDVDIDVEDIAFIQYTSGSTGFPKGVMISHRSLLGNCEQLATITIRGRELKQAKGDVMVSWTPQYHDFGLLATFMASIWGSLTTYSVSPLDFIQNPLVWHEMVVRYKAKFTTGPNFSYGLVSKRVQQFGSKGKWDSLDAAINAAEPIDPKVLLRMRDVLGIRPESIQVAYGMAETGLYITTRIGELNKELVACGPVDGFSTIRIVDKDGHKVQDGDVGEIWVQNSLVASGYWEQAELSGKTYKNELAGYDGYFLATGDLGKCVDGQLYVTGRAKEVIILNGKNHYPVDIERTIEESFPDAIRPGCNVAFQYSPSSVGLVMELRKGIPKEQQPSLQEIRILVSETHGVTIAYMRLLKDHTIPKTTSGKLQRRKTRDISLDDGWKKEAIMDSFNWSGREVMEVVELDNLSLAMDDTRAKNDTSTIVSSSNNTHSGLHPTTMPLAPAVKSNLSVVVVGSGAAALTCALTLAQNNVHVLVLDTKSERSVSPFGYYLREQSPNSYKQWEELDIKPTEVPQKNATRFFADGHLLDPPDPNEVSRFVDEMTELLDTREFENGQTIGQYLDSSGYTEDFMWQYFLGNVIALFGGGNTQEYLDAPVHLVAWLFMTSIRNLDQPLLCVDHKLYHGALEQALRNLGVEMHMGVEAKLFSRSEDQIKIQVGATTSMHDKLVLALPPDEAADFLGPQATVDELMLRSFEVRDESVILHRDTKYVRAGNGDIVHVRLPQKKGEWPSRLDTAAFTFVDKTDGSSATTPYATYSFDNAEDLSFYEFYGTTDRSYWRNVRRSNYTYRLQFQVERNQGQLSTYMVGGWAKGLMMHEDAILSGMGVANMILIELGEQPVDILGRMIPSPKFGQLDISTRSTTRTTRKKMVEICRASAETLSVDTVRSSLKSSLGREVGMNETVSQLGLSSMEVSTMHSMLLEKLNMDAEDFPIDWLFEGDITISELVSRIHAPKGRSSVHSRSQSVSENLEAAAFEAVLESTMEILEDFAEVNVMPSHSIQSLKLSAMEMKEFYTELCEAFLLQSDRFPLSFLTENKKLTVEEIASRIFALSEESKDKVPMFSTGVHAHPPPTLVSFSLVNQLVAMMIPPIFLGLASYPSWFLYMYMADGQFLSLTLFAMTPVFALIYATSAATLLVAFKWALVGRQKPGYFSVWSVPFAMRWAVRQCARLCWTLSPLAWIGGTETHCKILRMLGCKIGRNVSVALGAIDDYDLVEIGSDSAVDGMLNTELVSLGVQTLGRIQVGTGCSIATGSVLEYDTRLGDNVTVREVTLVPRGTVLEGNSYWHGSPAAEYIPPAVDIEAASLSLIDTSETGEAGRRIPFEINGLATFLVVSPYLFAIELGSALAVGYALWKEFGWIGFGALIWVLPTTAMLVATFVALFSKWFLLGRISVGSWPLYGYFHCSKWFVDHLVDHHVLLWTQFSMFFGSPIVMSAFFQVTCLRLFGAQVDRITRFPPTALKNYDLLEIQDGALVGGGAELFCFETVGGRIHGKKVRLGKDSFVGTKSVLLAGASVSDRGSVAAYSLVADDLGPDQILVGTKKLRNSGGSVSDYDPSRIHWLQRIEEEAALYTSLSVWAGASTVALLIVYFLEHKGQAFANVGEIYLAVLTSVISASVLVVAPLYSYVMLVITKIILVAQFVPEELSEGSGRRMAFCKAWDFAMDFCFRFFVLQAYAGTFIEVTLQKSLGADIGSRVYLDGIWLFEPDLVTIGDDTSVNNFATLVPHQYSTTGIEYGRVRIGNRCTVGSKTTIHGRAIADDNTEVSALSMPLIGTHLTSGGRWTGYPATKTPGLVYQPPRPPLPTWWVLIQHPFSIVFGAIWMVVLLLDRVGLCFCCRRRSQSYTQVDRRPELPLQLMGQFVHDRTGTIFSFENGLYNEKVRYFKMVRNTYTEPLEDTNTDPWWSYATYHWTFDADVSEGHGQVQLGFWSIPLEILTAKLVRREDGWEWTHCWFRGEALRPMKLQSLREGSLPISVTI